MRKYCAAALKRAEMPLLVIASLVWPLSMFVMFKACFGAVRECDIDTLSAVGWAVVLSLPLWLATCTIRSNSLYAKLLRVGCLLYLGAISVFGFRFVSSSGLAWLSGSSDFRLMAASIIFLPYLLMVIASVVLVRRIFRDVGSGRR